MAEKNLDIAESAVARLLDLAEDVQKKLNYLSDVASVKGVVLPSQMARLAQVVQATFVAAQVLLGDEPEVPWDSFPADVRDVVYLSLLKLQADLDDQRETFNGAFPDMCARLNLVSDACFHAATFLGYKPTVRPGDKVPNPQAWSILYLGA
jgi:hypothetical protein